MGLILSAWLLTFGAAMLLALLGVAHTLSRSKHRWGYQHRHTERSGEGAYRTGEVTIVARRHVPVVVRIAAIAAAMWAVITGVVLVPAGILLVLGSSMLGAMGPALFGLLAVPSGLALSIALGATAIALPERKDDTLVAAAVRFDLAHHIAVWIALTALSWLLDDDVIGWAPAIAVPCGIGVMLSGLLRAALASMRRDVTSSVL